MNIAHLKIDADWQKECFRIKGKPEATTPYLAGTFRALWRQEYTGRRADLLPPETRPRKADGYDLRSGEVELVSADCEKTGIFCPVDWYATESDIETGDRYAGTLVITAIWLRGIDVFSIMSSEQVDAMCDQLEGQE